MVDNMPTPSSKKPHPGLLVGVIALIFVVIGLGIFMMKEPVTENVVVEETTTQEQATLDVPETPAPPSVTIDVNAALSDRILGSTSAPVKISEHASFTCGHCGDFHRETFAQIKRDYIDTGKVYFVFSDFPLNAPAIHASMVARCLPQDKYFDFVNMLFQNQKDWAFDSNYLAYLKARAAENGLDNDTFEACIQNTDLQNGIVNRMKGIQQQWNISSTPSFVINNRTTVTGAQPYEEFKKLIDAELAASATQAPAPATEATSEPVAEEPVTEEVPDEATPSPDVVPETDPTTESIPAPSEGSAAPAQ